jgi:hypothetical protein
MVIRNDNVRKGIEMFIDHDVRKNSYYYQSIDQLMNRGIEEDNENVIAYYVLGVIYEE